ncbi:MAG TPA: energy transducer TonB, partial [Acidobacteriaceae bacterium]|nr:energy transducer TonB [Acidobacteriaceae bacterium]
MPKSAFILFAMALLVSACRAETRWCDVTGHGDGDKLVYPPIARAASISGTILARVTYSPEGEVKDVTVVSGPRLLATPVATQLKT